VYPSRLLPFLLAVSALGCGNGSPSESPKLAVKKETALPFTKEQIANMPGDKLIDGIRQYAQDKLNSDEAGAFAKLPRGIQIVYSVEELEGEVNNGGFRQYFWNSSGAHAQVALEALRAIGATQHAEITTEAIKVDEAENQDSKDTNAFKDSDHQDRLGELDKRYFDLKEDTRALEVKYARKHPDQFFTGAS